MAAGREREDVHRDADRVDDRRRSARGRRGPARTRTSAPASRYATSRAIVSSRSSTPRMWFSARAGEHQRLGLRVRCRRGLGDALARPRRSIHPVRSPGRSPRSSSPPRRPRRAARRSRRRRPDRPGSTLAVDVERHGVAAASAATCATSSSRVTCLVVLAERPGEPGARRRERLEAARLRAAAPSRRPTGSASRRARRAHGARGSGAPLSCRHSSFSLPRDRRARRRA